MTEAIMTEIVTREESSHRTSGISLPLPSTERQRRARLVLVDDDDLVRGTLERMLIDADFEVRGFASGPDALAHLVGGADVDVALLDWKMPGMSGLEVLRRIREARLSVPAIFLTGLADPACEEIALKDGAVDFVAKTRSFSILLQRIKLILSGVKPPASSPNQSTIQIGPLLLRRDVFRAFWQRRELVLTVTEFKIVDLLVTQRSEYVSYRAIYDVVHGKDFLAGVGDEGYRANVRTFIKRIRRKFRELDDEWDMIENYSKFGYRWIDWKKDRISGSPSAVDTVASWHF